MDDTCSQCSSQSAPAACSYPHSHWYDLIVLSTILHELFHLLTSCASIWARSGRGRLSALFETSYPWSSCRPEGSLYWSIGLLAGSGPKLDWRPSNLWKFHHHEVCPSTFAQHLRDFCRMFCHNNSQCRNSQVLAYQKLSCLGSLLYV